MIANVSIAKLDGGYLIICGEKMAIKTDIKGALIQVKQWVENPPFLFKEKIADIFGFDTKEKENKESPDWVNEILK